MLWRQWGSVHFRRSCAKNVDTKTKVMGVRLVWKRILWLGGSPTKNPKGPLKGKYKVIRGGSWINYAVAADRTDAKPGKRLNFVGFRCVK